MEIRSLFSLFLLLTISLKPTPTQYQLLATHSRERWSRRVRCIRERVATTNRHNFQWNNGESVILVGRCCDNDTATHGYVFILADWNPRMKNDDEGDRRCCDHWNRVNGHSPDEALSRFYCQSGSCLRLVPSWEERRNKRERLSKKFEKPGGGLCFFYFFHPSFSTVRILFFFSLFLFFSPSLSQMGLVCAPLESWFVTRIENNPGKKRRKEPIEAEFREDSRWRERWRGGWRLKGVNFFFIKIAM